MTVRADWIILDARIWTGAPDAPAPSATGDGPALPDAMALRGGRVLAVGSRDDVLNLRGPDTAVISAEGRFILPGFVDAHTHLLAGGLQLFRVDLRGVTSRQEFTQRVADRTRTTPPGEWILGGDWNQADWGGGFPTREWLDARTPHHPVFLQRMDLHIGVANSVALERAGIDADTPDPDNGTIDRDPETGEPTGVLRESAMRPLLAVIPDVRPEDARTALRTASYSALTRGITQVHDMGAVHEHRESWISLETLETLAQEGRLPIRVSAALPMADWRRAAQLVALKGRGGGRLHWGRVKAFVDGSFGSSTAWLHEPWTHLPDRTGTVVTDLDVLRVQVAEAVTAGLQPAIHAIGDRANDWLLDTYEAVIDANPGRDLRLRVEHAQHLSPGAAERMGRLGVTASIQPAHIIDDAPFVRERLGDDRESRSYAFGALDRAGVPLALGSDWPVSGLDPITAIWSAVTRRIPPMGTPACQAEGTGGGIWLPDQRLTLDRALRGHTLHAAHAAFLERETGSLEPGKQADFAALSANPFETPADALCETVQVDATWVGGVRAWRREDTAEAPWAGPDP